MLDRAQISTLHSFCLELVSRHFTELGLSPRLTTLEAAQSSVLENETLEGLFETYFEAKAERARAAKKLLLEWFKGDDGQARTIIRKLHTFTQALPDPAQWLASQKAILSNPEPALWRELYVEL